MFTIMNLGFLKEDFSEGGQFDSPPPFPFMLQEELIQYQNNFIQLLNKLFEER